MIHNSHHDELSLDVEPTALCVILHFGHGQSRIHSRGVRRVVAQIQHIGEQFREAITKVLLDVNWNDPMKGERDATYNFPVV